VTSGSEETLDEGDAEAVAYELGEGARIDRFVIRRRVGSGGMGVVYAAYDPELDRNIALKLLHSGHAEGQTRLLREARAMAKLSHPNVIAIHDVGVHEGKVFLAMELIEGLTLRGWFAQGPHAWTDVVRVFMMAGRGLAAAHDKGLVHRDFKPENVMLDSEGRVRVMDFGLVQSVERPVSGVETDRRADALAIELTQRGRAMGTPAYMAPEQYQGTATDVRTDQFAFCIALFEALHGERPFAGDSPATLMLAVIDGAIRTPTKSRVPAWLRRLVRRGLAVDPDRRWPSMHALLAEIERGQARVRMQRGIFAVVAVAAIGGAAWGWHAWNERLAAAECERLGEEIAELWPERIDAVRAGLAASGIPDVEATVERIQPWLDRWTEAWRTTRTETCSTDPDRMSPITRARIEACLDVQRRETEAVVEALEQATAQLAGDAVSTVAVMQSPADCADELRLGRVVWPDPDQLEAVTEIRGRLGRARVLNRTGRLEEALAEVEALAPDVEALGWAPLAAELEIRRGDNLSDLGRFDEAEPVLREAYYGAGQAGADLTAAEAATLLVHVVGYSLARHEEGLRWGEQATMHLARVGAEDGLEASMLANSIAGIHFDRGELDKAKAQVERTLEVQEPLLGSDHPVLAAPIHNLAGLARAAGRYDEAQQLYRRAIAIRRAALGLDHLGLVASYASLAAIHLERGEHDEAQRLLLDALAIVDLRLPTDHADRALVINSLAAVHRAKGELDDAVRRYTEAIGIWERTLGPDHPEIAAALNNLGNAYDDRDEYDRAGPLHERALAIWEKAYGPDHPYLAGALTSLGDTRWHQRRYAESIAALERALAIREGRETPHEQLGETRFMLARALWDGAGDRTRARELARLAAADFDALGPGRAAERREAEAWLESTTDPR
jgi:tetratricopeptide (TPR) repeat protein